MIKSEKSIVFDAPVEAVFAYLIDPAHMPEYEPSLHEVKDIQSLPNGGFTYTAVVRALGLHVEFISIPPRSTSFVDLLGPPVEQRSGADALALPLEGGTAGELRVFEVLDAREVLVDQGGVGQRPEVLGGLQLGGIGRQKQQVHMIRHAQMDAGVPAGAIQDEHNLLVGAGTDLAGERGQFHLKERNADGGSEMEDGPAGSGMDEAHEVAPGEAVLHGGDRTVADWRPDAAQQRLQADPMFVGRPQFDLRVGKRRRHCLQQRP